MIVETEKLRKGNHKSTREILFCWWIKGGTSVSLNADDPLVVDVFCFGVNHFLWILYPLSFRVLSRNSSFPLALKSLDSYKSCLAQGKPRAFAIIMMHHMTLMQEGPINTLALNRDCNKVVVTGRNGNGNIISNIQVELYEHFYFLNFSLQSLWNQRHGFCWKRQYPNRKEFQFKFLL